MRVHIACYDDKHIVPRMARWLSEGNGWSLGNYTDPAADINYYMPYTMFGRYGRASTKTAAWFTHYEVGNHAKVNIWHNAERHMGLRCYTADVYADRLLGMGVSAKVTPGVDQSHFKIKRRKSRKKPVVGVVGVGSDRKGPELLDAITSTDTKLSIAGRGYWNGHEAQWYSYEDMPAFYNGLDVYVCTATIEGIPAPPIEALACGVKVVVPIGVGAMGELPDTDGVRHYEAGDADDLKRALQQALDDDPTRSSLRDAVVDYTIDAWCESHVKALEMLL